MHHLVKVQEAVLVVMAHDRGAFTDRHIVSDADQVKVRHIQGVDHNVLPDVRTLHGQKRCVNSTLFFSNPKISRTLKGGILTMNRAFYLGQAAGWGTAQHAGLQGLLRLAVNRGKQKGAKTSSICVPCFLHASGRKADGGVLYHCTQPGDEQACAAQLVGKDHRCHAHHPVHLQQ